MVPPAPSCRKAQLLGCRLKHTHPHTTRRSSHKSQFSHLQKGVIVVEEGNHADGDGQIQQASRADRLGHLVCPGSIRIPAKEGSGFRVQEGERGTNCSVINVFSPYTPHTLWRIAPPHFPTPRYCRGQRQDRRSEDQRHDAGGIDLHRDMGWCEEGITPVASTCAEVRTEERITKGEVRDDEESVGALPHSPHFE